MHSTSPNSTPAKDNPATKQKITDFHDHIVDISRMVIEHYSRISLGYDKSQENITNKIGSALGSASNSGLTAGGKAAAVVFPLAPYIGMALGFVANQGINTLFSKLDPDKKIPEQALKAILKVGKADEKASMRRCIEKFATSLTDSFKSQIIQLTDYGSFTLAAVAVGRAFYYVARYNMELNADNLLEGVHLGFSGKEWLHSKNPSKKHKEHNFFRGKEFTNNRLETIELRKSHPWTAEGLINESFVWNTKTGQLYYPGKKQKLEKRKKGELGMPKYGIRKWHDIDTKLQAKNKDHYTLIPENPELIIAYEQRFQISLKKKKNLNVNDLVLNIYSKINLYHLEHWGMSIPFREFIVFFYENPNYYDDLYKFTSGSPSVEDIKGVTLNFRSFPKEKRYNPEEMAITFVVAGIRNPSKGIYLKAADFSQLYLQGVDFSGIIMPYANFTGSTLIDANFSGAQMPKAIMVGAIADGADFRGAKLPHANITEGSFYEADFESADIRNLTHVRGSGVQYALNLDKAETSFDLDEFIDSKINLKEKEEIEYFEMEADRLLTENDFVHAVSIYERCANYYIKIDDAFAKYLHSIYSLGACYKGMQSWLLAEANFNIIVSFKLTDSLSTQENNVNLMLYQVKAYWLLSKIAFLQTDELKQNDLPEEELKKRQVKGYANAFKMLKGAKEILKENQEIINNLSSEKQKDFKEILAEIEMLCGMIYGKFYWFTIALNEDRENFFQNAIESYESAIRLNDNLLGKPSLEIHCKSNNNLADLYEIQGDIKQKTDTEKEGYYSLALKAVNQAIQIATNKSQNFTKEERAKIGNDQIRLYYYNMGSILFKWALSSTLLREDLLERAATAFREASRIDSKHIATWHYRIVVHELLQKNAIAKSLAEDARRATLDDPRIMVDFAAACLQKILDIHDDAKLSTAAEEVQKRKLAEKALGALTVAIDNLKRAKDSQHPDTSRAPCQTRTDKTLIDVQLAKAYALQGEPENTSIEIDHPGLWTLEAQRQNWDELAKVASVFKETTKAEPLQADSRASPSLS